LGCSNIKEVAVRTCVAFRELSRFLSHIS
jgi:hypothetical protein